MLTTEKNIAARQAKLTSTASAAKDLGLIVFPRQSSTANCNPQPSLQVYGDPINHVTGFIYLGSKMASAASDLKRRKALAWSAFWKLERLLKGSHLTIFAKMKLFLHHLCDNYAFATACYRITFGIKRQY